MSIAQYDVRMRELGYNLANFIILFNNNGNAVLTQEISERAQPLATEDLSS